MNPFYFFIFCFLFVSSCSFDNATDNEEAEEIALNSLSQNPSSNPLNSYDSLQSSIKNTNQKVLGDFVIIGKINDASGLLLQLQLPTPKGISVLYQTRVDSAGNFRLTGGLTFPIYMYNLQLATNSDLTISLPIKIADSIHLNTSLSTFAQKPNISGVRWSEQANEIIAKNYMLKRNLMKFQMIKIEMNPKKKRPFMI